MKLALLLALLLLSAGSPRAQEQDPGSGLHQLLQHRPLVQESDLTVLPALVIPVSGLLSLPDVSEDEVLMGANKRSSYSQWRKNGKRSSSQPAPDQSGGDVDSNQLMEMTRYGKRGDYKDWRKGKRQMTPEQGSESPSSEPRSRGFMQWKKIG